MRQDLKKIVDFSEYWLSKTKDGTPPAFRDLLPEEIFRSLPNLVAWQALEGGRDFYCRLCGEDLNRNYGWNPKGQRLSAIVAENPSVAVFGDNFRLCLSRGSPLTVIDSFQGHRGTAKRTLGIIAPLTGEDGSLSEVICCSVYLTDDDHREAGRQLADLFPGIENRG